MSSNDSIQSHVRIATGLSLAIASVSVILRFIARRLLKQHVFLDDFLIFVALVFEWGIGIAGIILLQNGLGLHISHVSPDNLVTYMMVLYAGAPLYALTIVSIKISLLLLYHRLFPVKYMTYSCLVVGTVVVAWGLATMITGLFLCSPVRKLWYPKTPGQCLDLGQFYYGIQIPNIITDIAILLLPVKAIYHLPIGRREKGMLSGIFGLGALVVVFDIIRFTVMVDLAKSGPDITWNQVATSVWTCVEPAVAISIACLVHLRPVIKWLKEYWKPDMHSNSAIGFNNGRHESSAASTTSIIDDNRGNLIVEKGPLDSGVEFGTNPAGRAVCDAEAGLVKHPARTPSHSASSTDSKYAPLGCEAPSFPAIVDLLARTQPTEPNEGHLILTPISDTDGGPGPAIQFTEPFSMFGALAIEVENEKETTDGAGSTKPTGHTILTMVSDPGLRSKLSPSVALHDKPLPSIPRRNTLKQSN